MAIAEEERPKTTQRVTRSVADQLAAQPPGASYPVQKRYWHEIHWRLPNAESTPPMPASGVVFDAGEVFPSVIINNQIPPRKHVGNAFSAQFAELQEGAAFYPAKARTA